MPVWRTLLASGAAFMLAALILLAAGLPDEAHPAAGPEGLPVVGALAPPFSGLDLEGHFISLETWRERPVIVTFWATWCAPCQVEMPALQALYEAGSPDGLHIVAINVDEPPEVFAPWAVERGLTFPLLADPTRSIQTQYRLRGVPQTVVIDRAGVIREIFYGPVPPDRLQQAVAAAGACVGRYNQAAAGSPCLEREASTAYDFK